MIRCVDLTIEQGDFMLSKINFEIKRGDYTVLMGRTGCGKTTILESICGLRKVDSGEIWIGNKNITNYLPAQREIGYVPQDSALFKNMTIANNIGFALKIRKWGKQKINERVHELAENLDIEYLLQREAHDLSGGEKQRVALARALSFYPDVLCLDEPLSALDDYTKIGMYDLLLSLKNNLDITVLHVSHSNIDAQKLADTVLDVSGGIIKEIKPQAL